MFDDYEMQQVEEARAELRKIETPKDFYRIVNAVYDKYGSDIVNKARELENAWCY